MAYDVRGQLRGSLVVIRPCALPGRSYVRRMRPLPVLAAVVSAAVLIASVVASKNWIGNHLVLVVIGALATAIVAFNWWELWSTRHER